AEANRSIGSALDELVARLEAQAGGAPDGPGGRVGIRIAYYEIQERAERLDLELRGLMARRLATLDLEYLAALWLTALLLVLAATVIWLRTRREAAILGELRAANAEQEVLLRELNHRTKNNMNVISSWLGLESMRSADPAVRAVLHEADARIQAMALVHSKLYQGGKLSSLDLGEYLRELLGMLREAYASGREGIRVEGELESVTTSIDAALPCGLIVNELFSNSLKHAFPDGRPGRIAVALRRGGGGEIELSYSDDGVGCPEGFSARSQSGLGLRTVVAIGEDQLRGRLAFATRGGFACSLSFGDADFRPRV
ncbi:MAG TPA: sensor histidine kinase, partial [Rectinemataceae bacterium]|nr:sensor histidine kinase [Rectinemataceae bacterium]